MLWKAATFGASTPATFLFHFCLGVNLNLNLNLDPNLDLDLNLGFTCQPDRADHLTKLWPATTLASIDFFFAHQNNLQIKPKEMKAPNEAPPTTWQPNNLSSHPAALLSLCSLFSSAQHNQTQVLVN